MHHVHWLYYIWKITFGLITRVSTCSIWYDSNACYLRIRQFFTGICACFILLSGSHFTFGSGSFVRQLVLMLILIQDYTFSKHFTAIKWTFGVTSSYWQASLASWEATIKNALFTFVCDMFHCFFVCWSRLVNFVYVCLVNLLTYSFSCNLLLQATSDHYSIGLKILNQLVSEMNQVGRCHEYYRAPAHRHDCIVWKIILEAYIVLLVRSL